MADNLKANAGSRIGCHCWGTKPEAVNALPTLAEVGCRWVRATRQTQMDTVATGRRQYDFARGGEHSVDLALANGMSIMAILDSRWGNETRHNDLPWASPIWEHLDEWEHFATAAVQRYKGRITYWEIINEPPFFWWYPTPEGITHPEVNPELKRAPLWAYVELLRASARAIRLADPAAKIVLGSGFPDGSFLKRIYELGGKDCFDIASVHYLNCRHPADFARGYRRLRQIMADFGDAAKPLWDTENGPAGAVIGHAVAAAGEYEALYNVYRHCFAHEFGLDRYFWFSVVSDKPYTPAQAHAYGLRDAAGVLAPPYQAIGTLSGQLGEGRLLRCAHPGGEVHVYVFSGAQGPVSLLWSTAPARVRLPGGPREACSHLGAPVPLPGDAFAVTGAPLYIPGNILDGLDVSIGGRRETVVKPMKQPGASVRPFTSPRVAPALALPDVLWADLPFVVRRGEIPVIDQNNHFCKVTSSVTADLQLAHNDEALFLRARTCDPYISLSRHGLVQFSLRDDNPAVAEWGYFVNGYGLFSLFAGRHGAQFLRHEHLYWDEYPTGVVPGVPFTAEAQADGLLFSAAVPWREIGPCRPGRHNPCLMLFTFNRADFILDLPESDAPEEWSHNFVDNFIVKPPALSLRVTFG